MGSERQQYSYIGSYGNGDNQSRPSQGLDDMAFAGGNSALDLFPVENGIGSGKSPSLHHPYQSFLYVVINTKAVVAGIRSDSGFISSQHGNMSGRFAHSFGDPPTGVS